MSEGPAASAYRLGLGDEAVHGGSDGAGGEDHVLREGVSVGAPGGGRTLAEFALTKPTSLTSSYGHKIARVGADGLTSWICLATRKNCPFGLSSTLRGATSLLSSATAGSKDAMTQGRA